MKPYARLIAALLLLALLSAGYAFWYHELDAARAEAATLAAEVATEQSADVAASVASAELSSLGADEAAVNAYFVDPGDVVPFLETLQDTGTRLGASVDVVSVTAVPDPHPHLDLSLVIAGPFAAVVKTVGAIEYAPYDIETESLALSTSDTDAAAPWTAAMTFSVGTTASSSAATSTPAASTSAPASPKTPTPAGPAFTQVPAPAP